MSLPIDEMLTELRAVLEAFEADPSDDTMRQVSIETWRITTACEDELEEPSE